MLVKNWKQMWKSYAVLLPSVVTAIYVILQGYTDSGLAQNNLDGFWLPILVFITSLLGRVVKQYNLNSPNGSNR